MIFPQVNHPSSDEKVLRSTTQTKTRSFDLFGVSDSRGKVAIKALRIVAGGRLNLEIDWCIMIKQHTKKKWSEEVIWSILQYTRNCGAKKKWSFRFDSLCTYIVFMCVWILWMMMNNTPFSVHCCTGLKTLKPGLKNGTERRPHRTVGCCACDQVSFAEAPLSRPETDQGLRLRMTFNYRWLAHGVRGATTNVANYAK